MSRVPPVGSPMPVVISIVPVGRFSSCMTKKLVRCRVSKVSLQFSFVSFFQAVFSPIRTALRVVLCIAPVSACAFGYCAGTIPICPSASTVQAGVVRSLSMEQPSAGSADG